MKMQIPGKCKLEAKQKKSSPSKRTVFEGWPLTKTSKQGLQLRFPPTPGTKLTESLTLPAAKCRHSAWKAWGEGGLLLGAAETGASSLSPSTSLLSVPGRRLKCVVASPKESGTSFSLPRLLWPCSNTRHFPEGFHTFRFHKQRLQQGTECSDNKPVWGGVSYTSPCRRAKGVNQEIRILF